MPSLRRTFSSPSVRSAPYPSSLSSSANVTRAQPNGHRRSSGSETIGRRVLADLEWWRVMDGQLDSENRGDTNDEGEERPSTPLVVSNDESHELLVTWTTTQLAALSPQTPPRRRSAHSQESSLESTPELDERVLDERRRVFDVALTDLPSLFTDGSPWPSSSLSSRRPKRTRRLIPGRSHTFSHFTLPTAFPMGKDDYADFSMSPFSSHPPDLYD